MSLSKPWSASATLLGALLLGAAGPAAADNPVVQTRYTADPAPMVYDGRVWLFTGHDEDGADYFDMVEWRLYSTDDMANWQDHGAPLGLDTFEWADLNAWAPQAIERNGQFYFYGPMRREGGSMSIGVGVSDNITGPYRDAIGAPLVENAEIDPTVFIDDDGQAYMYWGNPNLWYVLLNEDMISYSGEPVQVELTEEGFGVREGESDRPTAYEEGPWLYKRDGTYYLLYAANCCAEDLRYATGPSATGPWTYRGLIMATEGSSFTNHPGYVEYEGQPYFFYHNGALPGGGGYQRSCAVESFDYESDGSIPLMTMSEEGPAQIRSLDPFVRQEAETIAWSVGLTTEANEGEDGGIHVTGVNDGDYIKVAGVDFGEGASSLEVSVASDGPGGAIEVRLDGEDGELVGTCEVAPTGGSQAWETVSCDISGAEGVNDLYFRFTGDGEDDLFNFDWWQFE